MVLEELECLATEEQIHVHHLRYSLLTLFFSLNTRCCSLHSSCSTKRLLRTCQTRPFAHSMGFCVAPFASLSKSALSVSICRKTLFPWRHLEGLGQGGSSLTGQSSSVNLLHVLLPKGHRCVARRDYLSSQIVDALLTKSDFLENCWVFLQAIFYDVTSYPKEHFWFWAEMLNFFFTCFRQGRYLKLPRNDT